jgi:hypothetical protein
MTKKEANAYRRRWQLVEEVQKGEYRRLTIDDKLRQLDQCYQIAAELRITKTVFR